MKSPNRYIYDSRVTAKSPFVINFEKTLRKMVGFRRTHNRLNLSYIRIKVICGDNRVKYVALKKKVDGVGANPGPEMQLAPLQARN